MAQTSQMPKSVQSDIAMEAVGEALLQHYNVGITNPWFEAGHSDQETYNRRKLPWSGKTYTVEDGNVSGPNAEEIDENMKQAWRDMAEAATSELKGNRYEDLDALYEQGLTAVGSALKEDAYREDVQVITEEGDTVTEEDRYLPPAER
jgi:hypothetical protein